MDATGNLFAAAKNTRRWAMCINCILINCVCVSSISEESAGREKSGREQTKSGGTRGDDADLFRLFSLARPPPRINIRTKNKPDRVPELLSTATSVALSSRESLFIFIAFVYVCTPDNAFFGPEY